MFADSLLLCLVYLYCQEMYAGCTFHTMMNPAQDGEDLVKVTETINSDDIRVDDFVVISGYSIHRTMYS